MAFPAISAFNILQEMRRDDMEIYHYCDAAPQDVTLHAHGFFELYCLLEGSMDYWVEGVSYGLGPGSLLLIGPGEMHRPDIAGPSRIFDRIVLWMNPRFVSSLHSLFPQALRAFDGPSPGRRLITPDEKTQEILLGLLRALLYEKEREDADSPYLCHLSLTQLLIHLSRLISRPSAQPTRPDARYGEILKVYEYINENYRRKISVRLLADQFYMDRNTLTRQFQRIIGLTPGEYIRRKRLEEARELLRQGCGVLDAGYQSGFTDYSAFFRAFRQLYGVSPSQIQVAREGEDAGAVRLRPQPGE